LKNNLQSVEQERQLETWQATQSMRLDELGKKEETQVLHWVEEQLEQWVPQFEQVFEAVMKY